MLEVRNLRTELATPGGRIRAVDDVSFDVGAGSVVGVVGESGCGKSVTALSVLGLLPGAQVDGEVVFEGRDVLRLDERDRRRLRGGKIAMIFQDPMTSLNPVLTVGRQITEALRLHRSLTPRAAWREAVRLLEQVGIPSAADRVSTYPHEFSGGMRQRVMIAMALSCHPQLLIADEPTTALDVTIQAQILDLLRSLNQDRGMAILLITHDLGVVAGMAERVQVMYAGQVVETALTGELFANPRMPYTWGLLNAVPRLDGDVRQRLRTIEGHPPDLRVAIPGCRFAARCGFRREVCLRDPPPLTAMPTGSVSHLARCWATQPGGWLERTTWTDAEPVAACAAGQGP